MSNSDAELAVLVPPEAVFSDLRGDETTLLELLRGLSRTDTLFWSARVNLIVAGAGHAVPKERQQRALNLFCTPEEIRRINAFAESHGGADRVRVFFRGQLLELLRWVSAHSTDQADGSTFDDPEVRRRFVQAALVASALWSDRVFGDRFRLDGGIEVARRRGLAPIRKSIEEAGTAPELQNPLGRGWVLFSEHLRRRYPDLAEEFRTATGLSLEEYFVCVAAVTIQYLGPEAATPIMNWRTTAEATPYREIFQRYVELESLTAGELASACNAGDAGYRALRERPMLRTEDGRAIVLDPVFYSERASVGPLFDLVGSGSAGSGANRIFGAFGLAFEDYTADILTRMYPGGSGLLVSRLGLNVHGRDGAGRPFEIDAVLNDGTEIVAFETKAAWLREDRIRDDTYDEYLEHLREKYGVRAGRSAGERVKGVGQLARSIGAIASREWLGPHDAYRMAELIYPVLVVHDALLGAPVYGNFLATELEELLRGRVNSGEARERRVRIAPLTVVTIADLEALEESVNHFALRDLLRDYTRECPDRLRSLHNFIAFSSYCTTMYRSAYLPGKTAELMRRVQEALFPHA